MPAILIYLAVGAGLGAALGHFGKCASGTCPLTKSWRQGALYGATVAAVLFFILGRGDDPELNRSTDHVTHISEAEFDAQVAQAPLPVVVDFYATWCGPCRLLAPTVDNLAAKYAGRIKFVKVNVDESPKLAQQFQVEGIPMLVLFKGGKVVDSSVGLIAGASLAGKLEQLLQTNAPALSAGKGEPGGTR